MKDFPLEWQAFTAVRENLAIDWRISCCLDQMFRPSQCWANSTGSVKDFFASLSFLFVREDGINGLQTQFHGSPSGSTNLNGVALIQELFAQPYRHRGTLLGESQLNPAERYSSPALAALHRLSKSGILPAILNRPGGATEPARQLLVRAV